MRGADPTRRTVCTTFCIHVLACGLLNSIGGQVQHEVASQNKALCTDDHREGCLFEANKVSKCGADGCMLSAVVGGFDTGPHHAESGKSAQASEQPVEASSYTVRASSCIRVGYADSSSKRNPGPRADKQAGK